MLMWDDGKTQIDHSHLVTAATRISEDEGKLPILLLNDNKKSQVSKYIDVTAIQALKFIKQLQKFRLNLYRACLVIM